MIAKRRVKFNGTDKSHVTRSLNMRQKQRESDRKFLHELSDTLDREAVERRQLCVWTARLREIAGRL